MYHLTAYEKQLMNNDSDLERLTYLQTKSSTPLQFICEKKQFYIKSIIDDDQFHRIIVLSLLLKIFKNQSSQNQQRMNLFKQIVYSSNLTNLTNSKGLLKEQMHKSVAVNLFKIKNSNHYEESIIKLFNSTPFFDEVLIQSFKEYFDHQFNSITIDRLFETAIVWKERWSQPINDQEIVLISNLKNILLPALDFKGDAECMYFSARSQKQELNQQKEQLLTISIQSFDKQTDNKENLDFENRTSQKITIFEIPAKKPKKTSMWSFLCCGTD